MLKNNDIFINYFTKLQQQELKLSLSLYNNVNKNSENSV